MRFHSQSINISMPADLTNEFISDLYTSLLHVSRASLDNDIDDVCDGEGTTTAIQLSGNGQTVILNNIIQPKAPSIIEFIDYIYPVGSVIMSLDDNNPQERFAGTTWEQTSSGKFIVGEGTGTDQNGVQSTFSIESNDGEYKHILIDSEMPIHGHPVLYNFEDDEESDRNGTIVLNNGGAYREVDANIGSPSYTTPLDNTGNCVGGAGGDQAHNNLPPSYGVYVWKRIS